MKNVQATLKTATETCINYDSSIQPTLTLSLLLETFLKTQKVTFYLFMGRLKPQKPLFHHPAFIGKTIFHNTYNIQHQNLVKRKNHFPKNILSKQN